jgi:hypothetical protein
VGILVIVVSVGLLAWWRSASPELQLRSACQRIAGGDGLERAVEWMPGRTYRPGCCNPAVADCGDRLICEVLPVAGRELLYNCEGEEPVCEFLWRARRVQCSLDVRLSDWQIETVTLVELPL